MHVTVQVLSTLTWQASWPPYVTSSSSCSPPADDIILIPIAVNKVSHLQMGIEDQLKKVKIPGPSALALSAL